MKKLSALLFVMILAIWSPTAVLAAPDTTLSITTANSTYAPQTTFYSDVVINTGSNTVVSGDIILNFDPAVLEAVGVQTGSFLPSSSIVTEQLDNTNGKVTISLFTHKENARQGTGTFTRIQWKAKNTGTTTISFDTQKTLVYGLQEGNVLQSTLTKQISVNSSGATADPTPTNTPLQTTPKLSPTKPTAARNINSNSGTTTYGQSFVQQSNEEPANPNIPDNGDILPSSSELDESIIDKLLLRIQDVFTPRGNEAPTASPQETPVFESQKTSSPFTPILFVWILGFLLLCGVGTAMYFKIFKNKKTGPILQDVTPEKSSVNSGS